ncbi:unnamed protein product [Protopolystoma xenopodis]|uniref:Uncharacterized protein n=1 Tax=Protopolystoma xenopodis TaxID=117903 RepID=A0A3S5C8I8_9PLAT|nr:unnamed protein product [Protopolystoma xenopodis]
MHPFLLLHFTCSPTSFVWREQLFTLAFPPDDRTSAHLVCTHTNTRSQRHSSPSAGPRRPSPADPRDSPPRLLACPPDPWPLCRCMPAHSHTDTHLHTDRHTDPGAGLIVAPIADRIGHLHK